MIRRHLRTGSFLAVAFATACNGEPTREGTYSRAELLNPETCKECHEQHFTEWSGSMHAYASEDPVFRAMNARGQRETAERGEPLGDFCVNCHAPLAVQEGATEDGLNLDTVPDHLQGITCYFCHQVTDVTGTHNNPLLLANDTTMRGAVQNPVKNVAHKSAYSELMDGESLKSSTLCGPCHDIVVPKHFSGAAEDVHLERTYAEWQASIFAVPEPALQSQACGDCHMQGPSGTTIANPPDRRVVMPANRTRHNHLFAGVDVALTEFPQKAEQRQAVQDLLEQTLRVQICWSQANTRVVLGNIGAGHYFPSGASQDRRVWVELHAFNGEVDVYQSGVAPAGVAVTTLTAPEPRILRDVATKLDGSPAHMFWDVAAFTSDTIPSPTPTDPRESVELDFDLLRDAALPRPAKIKVTVWVEPVGLDVLDDLIESGDLDAAIRDEMPRFDVLPNRHGKPREGVDPTVTLEWTEALATGGCVETASPRTF